MKTMKIWRLAFAMLAAFSKLIRMSQTTIMLKVC